MKKALIVVDYQKDFVSGSLGFPEAEKLDEKIAAKIEACLQEGGDLVFTFDTHGTDYLETLEGKNLPVVHCIKGSDGWELYGRTGDYLQKAAAVIEKEAPAAGCHVAKLGTDFYEAYDGAHPTLNGMNYIAQCWIDAIEKGDQ